MSVEFPPLHLFVFELVFVQILDQSFNLSCLKETDYLKVIAHERLLISRESCDEGFSDIVWISRLDDVPEKLASFWGSVEGFLHGEMRYKIYCKIRQR